METFTEEALAQVRYDDVLDIFTGPNGTVVPLENVPRGELRRVLTFYRDRATRYQAKTQKYEKMIAGLRALVQAVGL